MADVYGPEITYTDGDATIEEDPYFAYGGSIGLEDDAVVTLNDCVIEGGFAHHGGGLYAEHATLHVTDSNFVDNAAVFGGAVYYVDTEATVDKTRFSENGPSQLDVYSVLAEDFITVDIDTLQGGALAAFDANSVLTDIVVVQNGSAQSGGGIFVSGSDKTTIKNGLFAGNGAVRDGGALSVNWYSNMYIQNCTIADNDVLGTASGTSLGGGIFAGYQSYVDVNDCILWGNSATTGLEIAITSGFEFDQAPSNVKISYTDVDNYPNANAIYVESPSSLDVGNGVFKSDPKFVKLPGSALDDIASDYYLDQLTSPCIDIGSDNSITLNLFEYTTSIDGIQDKSVVDLGYHYQRKTPKVFCSYVELAKPANGRIDLADWAEFASWWLAGSCSEGDEIFGGNNWSGGGELNFHSYNAHVDLNLFVGCWLAIYMG